MKFSLSLYGEFCCNWRRKRWEYIFMSLSFTLLKDVFQNDYVVNFQNHCFQKFIVSMIFISMICVLGLLYLELNHTSLFSRLNFNDRLYCVNIVFLSPEKQVFIFYSLGTVFVIFSILFLPFQKWLSALLPLPSSV